MKDQDLKKMFQSMSQPQPSEMERARWKKAVRQALRPPTPAEWTRLAVACLVGMVIGATVFHEQKEKIENLNDDATIERVHINLQ